MSACCSNSKNLSRGRLFVRALLALLLAALFTDAALHRGGAGSGTLLLHWATTGLFWLISLLWTWQAVRPRPCCGSSSCKDARAAEEPKAASSGDQGAL